MASNNKKKIKPTDPIIASAEDFVTNWINRTHKNSVSNNINLSEASRHNKNIILNASFIYNGKEHKQYYVCKVDYKPTIGYVTRLNDDAEFKYLNRGNDFASNEIITAFDNLYDPSKKYQRHRFPKKQEEQVIIKRQPTKRDLINRMVRPGHDKKICEIISKLFGYEFNVVGLSMIIDDKVVQITNNTLEEYYTADGLPGYQFNFPINQKDRLVRIIFDEDGTLCSLEIDYLNTSFHIYTDAYFVSPIDKRDNGIDLENDKETMEASNTSFRYEIKLSDKEALVIHYSFSNEVGAITFPNNMDLLRNLNNPDLSALLTKIYNSRNSDRIIAGQPVHIMGKYIGYNEDMSAITGMIFFSYQHKQMIIKVLSEVLEKPENKISEIFDYICSLLRQEKIAQIFGNITPTSNKLATPNTYDTLRSMFKEETSLYVSPLNAHILRLPNSVIIYSGNYEVDDIPTNMKPNTNYLKFSYNPSSTNNEFRIIFGYLVNETRYFVNISFNPNKSMEFLLEIRIGNDTIQIKKGNFCINGHETNFELAKNGRSVLRDLSFNDAIVIVKDILKCNDFMNFIYAALNGLGVKNDILPSKVFRDILGSLCACGDSELIDGMIQSTIDDNTSPIPLSDTIANLTRRVIYSIPTIEAFNEIADNFISPTAPIEINSNEGHGATISRTITTGDTTTQVTLIDDGFRFLLNISRTVDGLTDPMRQPNISPKESKYSYHFALNYNLEECAIILEIPLHRFSCEYSQEIHIARPLVTIKIDPKNMTYSLSGDGVSWDINRYNSSIRVPKENTFWTPSKNIINSFFTNPSTGSDEYIYDTTISTASPINAREYILYILHESEGFKNVLIRLFKELGLANINDLPGILNMIFSLAGKDFISDFFGSPEKKDEFIENLSRYILQLTNNIGPSHQLSQLTTINDN